MHRISSFSATNEYKYINSAVHDLWTDFLNLKNETDSFHPRDRELFSSIEQEEFVRLSELNPDAPVVEIRQMAKDRADTAHQFQGYAKFNSRIMKLKVSSLFLSHALCEAFINKILALGLHANGTSELFEVWEKARFEDKWLMGPKTFCPAYEIDRGHGLCGTLRELTAQRNVFIHYKAEIVVAGVVVQKGKQGKRIKETEHMDWIRRFLSLPFDLIGFAAIATGEPLFSIIGDRGPIPVCEHHVK